MKKPIKVRRRVNIFLLNTQDYFSDTPEVKPIVLLVDDDDSYIRSSSRALRREQVEIASSNGLTPVIETLGDRYPAVAVIDWHLGHDVSRELVESVVLAYPSCAVIVFSGDSRPEERRNAITAGAWLWLSKLEAASLASFVAQGLIEHAKRKELDGLTMDGYKQRLVESRVLRYEGNITKAAKSLDISPKTLRRILASDKNAG